MFINFVGARYPREKPDFGTHVDGTDMPKASEETITDPRALVFPDAQDQDDVRLGEQILELLKSRGLAEGDRIPTEAELAGHFAATRQRVRGALRHLEGLGILRSRQGSGRVLLGRQSHTLPALLNGSLERSPAEILDVLSVRQVLEVGYLPHVIAQIDEEDLEAISAALLSMEDRAGRGLSFSTQDRDFHQSLFRCLNNPVLQLLLGNFWDLFESVDESALVHTENTAETVAHHRRIYEAVERRDTPMAQFHMNAHFYDVVKVLEDMVRRTAVETSA